MTDACSPRGIRQGGLPRGTAKLVLRFCWLSSRRMRQERSDGAVCPLTKGMFSTTFLSLHRRSEVGRQAGSLDPRLTASPEGAG